MKGRSITKLATFFAVLLFLVFLFLYTMAFPASTSWFIFLFFLVMFLGLYLTTRFKWGPSEAFLVEAPDGSKDVRLNVRTRGRLPILIPELQLRLPTKEGFAETAVPVYFKNNISPLFQDVRLPRGRHQSLLLETFGRDHFGLFSHYSRHSVPAKIDIFPESLTEKTRNRYMRKVAGHPLLRDYLKSNTTQFRQLREHGARDELKHIDWKTSAKKQKLMVKEYERESMPTLTISFWGMESAEFEELLQVAYSLYQELHAYVQLQVCLVGQYEGQTAVHYDELSFLLIQPSPTAGELLPFWQDLKIASGYHVAIMPAAFQDTVKDRRFDQTIILTEALARGGGDPLS